MNVLIIMSDEQSGETMSCAGHPIVQTPVLDRLASEGTMFTNCYTPSPICTPARASFITGQYAHRLGTWDNATPYDGQSRDMANYLHRFGRRMTSFGKLDLHPHGQYVGLNAMHAKLRNNPQFESYFRDQDLDMGNEKRFKNMGIREKESFDDHVRKAAVDWLQQKGQSEQPWVMYVGLLNPHFPFFVDEGRWKKYESLVHDDHIPHSAKGDFSELNEPLRQLRRHFRGDAVDEETLRKAHVGYYALTDKLDDNVGKILDALKESGQEDDTLIIFTSDHGEQLGRHGLWWKCCMYEESVRVPLIMKGRGIPQGAIIDHPVSLIDIFPTVCEAHDLSIPNNIPGRSLLPLARGEDDPNRSDFVFSEYHAHGVPTGMYMIRWKQWKYVYYVDYNPQLFDLDNDPEEMKDLYPTARHSKAIQSVLAACEKRLREVCDPEAVDQRARRFQRKMRDQLALTEYVPPAGMPVPHPDYSGMNS